MRYAEARQGRVFILRLEDGEVLHETIEGFARAHGIRGAALVAVGGAGAGSLLVTGPEAADARPIQPRLSTLTDVHEVVGTGTLFPDEEGNPTLHMHLACGRARETVTGCVRRGVKVWQVMELVLFELQGTDAKRVDDPDLGFKLLAP